MIYLLLIFGAVIFYFSIVGYLHLMSSRFENKKGAKWILWLTFCAWVGICDLAGIRLVATQAPELNKIAGMVPIAIGILASIILNKDLWKKCAVGAGGGAALGLRYSSGVQMAIDGAFGTSLIPIDLLLAR